MDIHRRNDARHYDNHFYDNDVGSAFGDQNSMVIYVDVDGDDYGDQAHGMAHDNHNGYSHPPRNDHVLFQDNHDGDDHDHGNDVHCRDAIHDQETVNILHDHSYEDNRHG